MNKITHQWLALNRTLSVSKWINLLLSLLLLILLIYFILQSNRPPLVVVQSKGEETFYRAKYQKIALNKERIETFLKNFIESYYNFNRYDPDLIMKKVAPFSTLKFQSQKKIKGLKKLKGKSVYQRVLNVKIHFQKKQVVATFIKVFIVEKVPFVMETHGAFKLKRGAKTSWNPMGIYIDGVMEYEKTP